MAKLILSFSELAGMYFPEALKGVQIWRLL